MATTKICATYRIVTPMFCAGANQQQAELRLASFKGALRFWWRTMMAAEFGDDIDALYNAEASLFGASDQHFGQSKVRMRLKDTQLHTTVASGKIFEGGRLKGAHYLGYGVMEAFDGKSTKAGRLTRPMIPSGEFTVAIRLTRSNAEETDQLCCALVFLGSLGGLGSKSRKGFGSMTIVKLVVDEESRPVVTDPVDRLRSVLRGPRCQNRSPMWTAMSDSPHQRFVQAQLAGKSATELLDAIGREQVFFRSWGSNNQGRLSEHRTLDQPSEQNFKFDHDLFKGKTNGDYPHRIAFGLPQNYGKCDDQKVSTASKNRDRRASPLFIHIDQLAEGVTPTALLAFLPSQFLPPNEKIVAFSRRSDLKQDDAFWYPIHGFLDRLVAIGNRPAPRSGYENFPDDKPWWNKQTAISAAEVTLG